MQRTQIVDALAATAPQPVIRLCGWVRTRRDAKGFSFLEINDGSCLANIQAIVDEGIPAYANIGAVSTGAAVDITGELVESPGKGQKWEVRVQTLTLLGAADAETYPLQKKRHSDEFLRSIAHLRARTNKYGAAFRIRSEAAFAIHEFYRERGFFYVHTPILTGSDCEGAGEMFRVTTLPVEGSPTPASGNRYENDFFGKECNLTVSGQLEAETLALGLGKVYTFGPTFRAENSNTPRHAAEFWMIEPEVAFADLEEDMNLAEDMTRTVVRRILDRCAADLDLFNRFVDTTLVERLRQIADEPFARCSYTEAIELLLKSGKKFEYPVSFGLDLQTEHERYLAEEHFGKPVIVYNYPKEIKAFYMRLNDDGRTVAAMDVLVPRIGELIGGSQREERLDVLEARINEMGQNLEDYWWYLDLRRFGSVPHAGFGMGFERLLMLLTGITNIRDVIPFPRTPGNLEF
ncbi:asparagine--tRNA ligase [Nitratidesulfovibrio vulgaris]|jgi:asparaginyl-tRNA synthetase|uniref:Asparagine--tRNA ligase n=1 Tax=Nitratidesulfovibrio vulgaris (strain DP4) TaxID=391774 RepID=SYN_NITV4|nr:asparagine--tRNA ligase [Nitratidesulfovibrio vulgaris]A1V9B8.1 RecName: Full=Asparagine--tRNA ligase; AltName: Full=Asparaginyl-tRNA synthetase; Short=AsnRS [Nitratidesulfovibrio vulgaris DP4]ABM27025.1 asparaginyl-tRNA synthetase [Nitratidesulfovibrio vulgaris DP4]GEB78859.1 asparagine--tRNA ligase [Desulfovibrio desulfuricans]